MSAVLEFFGHSSATERDDWQQVTTEQNCPFIGKRCYKVRKSDPDTSIGTCTVLYGKDEKPILICPSRLLERRQIFSDCLHLLTLHEPGNELHIVSEVSIPGGSVDFFLVSATDSKVRDFVGIELQTLDTTGTVWPERQRLLKTLGIPRSDNAEDSKKSFGMNWKMTAKTILVQMHHKVHTFEHVNKKLVLIVQDYLLEYMQREFNFGHMSNPAKTGDAMHMHAYSLSQKQAGFKLSLDTRLSTDTDGIATCLGLQAEAKVELEQITDALEARLSPDTLFNPV
ncbi:MAG: NotI family restriction endonuclease [Rhodospirillales bacterium]